MADATDSKSVVRKGRGGSSPPLANDSRNDCRKITNRYIEGMIATVEVDELRRIFGENTKAFREKNGMTQKQLAFAAKISQPFIGMIEAGKRSVSMEVQCAIAKALHTTPQALTMEGVLSGVAD